MNKGNLLAGLGALALFGGAGVVSGLLGGEGEPVEMSSDGGVDAGPKYTIVRTPSKAQMANKTVEDKDLKKPVRVVGVEDREFVADADPVTTDIGPAIKVAVGPRHMCNVLFLEKAKTVAGRQVPDTKAVTWEISEPVQVPGSCAADGCLWNVLLQGTECVKASLLPGYLGSTLKELKSLPGPMRSRALRVNGTCKDQNNKDYACTVPAGDIRAQPQAPEFFAHGWAGRPDMNLGFEDEQRQDLSAYPKTPEEKMVEVTPAPVEEKP